MSEAPARRVVCVFVVVVLVASLGSVGGAGAVMQPGAVVQFEDAGSGVHASSVEALAQLGVFEGTGCGEGLFCPGEVLERWVMAVWLVRLLAGPQAAEPSVTGSRFADVGSGVWWAPYVEALADTGVTAGCATEPARFCPHGSVTRAQMATFLVRAFDIEAGEAPEPFVDVGDGVHAASIGSLAASGVTGGCASGPARFCGDRFTTRAQMATFLVRVLGSAGIGEVSGEGAFFDDVVSGVHEVSVDALARLGVFDGTECGDGLFCPGGRLARWEMAVWLIRALNPDAPDTSGLGLGSSGRSRFVDVDAGEWWAPYVETLADTGVTAGCATEPARFCPHGSVTRAQMATFLVRAFDIEAGEAPEPFVDVGDGVHAASIGSLAASGVTGGCASGPARFCGDRFTTRAQMATFLKRARNQYVAPCPTESGAAAEQAPLLGGGGGPVGGSVAHSATVPAVPAGLMVTPGDRVLDVSWDSAFDGGSRILNYHVNLLRDTGVVGKDGEAQLDVLGFHASTGLRLRVDGDLLRDDAVLVNGGVYWVQVRARNAVAVSDWSDPVRAVPFTKPAAPSVSGVDPGPASLTVRWAAPPDDGGDPVQRYLVQWQPENGSYSTARQAEPGAAARRVLIDEDIINGVTYWVRVAAVNAAGPGPWSQEASAAPRSVPGPVSIRAGLGHKLIDLEWDAPPDGGSQIIDYTVQWKPSRGSYTSARKLTATGTGAQITTELVNGDSYHVRVAARNDVGTGIATVLTGLVPRNVPGQPRGLRTEEVGDRGLTLQWSPPLDDGGDDVIGYVLRWQGASSGQTRPATTRAVLTGLVNGSVYSVEVAAENGAGPGDAALLAGLVPHTTPGAPAINAVDPGVGRLVARWSAPVDTGGNAVTGYTLRWRDNNENFTDANWPAAQTIDDIDATSRTVAGLHDDTRYWVQVAAVNEAGTGAWSPQRSATTTTDEPRNLSATLLNGSLMLDWDPPPPTGGPPPISYRVQWKSGLDYNSTQQTTVSTTSALVTGLLNGTPYSVRITPETTLGDRPAAELTALVPRTRPGAVRNLHIEPTDAALNVAWDPPLDDGGNQIEHRVQWKSGTQNYSDSRRLTPTGTTATITGNGIVNGTSYDVAVFAVNEAGSGPITESHGTPAKPPSKPTGTSLGWDDSEITLSWSAPSDTGGGINDYHLRWRAEDQQYSDTQRVATVGADVSSYTVTGLVNGAGYRAQVAAANDAGQSQWAGDHLKATPRGKPGSPSITNLTTGNARITVSWNTPTNGGSVLIGYRVRWKNSVQEYDNSRIEPAVHHSKRNYAITGLRAGTYRVQVAARNPFGWSPWSEEDVVMLAEPPSAPLSLRAVPGDEHLDLSWQAPDGNGGATITGYQLNWTAEGEEPGTFTNLDNVTSHTLPGLRNGTKYAVTVAAVNRKGRGGWSHIVSEVPLSVPGTPAHVAAEPRHQLLRVTWEPPADTGGADITGYAIQWKTGTDDYNTPVTPAATARSHDITPLINDTTYTVQITARNPVGASAAVTVAAAPVAATAPGAPQMRVEPRENSLRVTWEPPASDGGADITWYAIQWKTGTDDYNTPVTPAATARSHDITPLINDTTYTVQITAANSAATGTPARTDAAPRTAVAPVTAPDNLRLLPLDRGLRAVWEPPRSDGGTPVTSYQIRWDTGSAAITDLDDLSHDITGLGLLNTHAVRVFAVNPRGEGPATASARLAGRPPAGVAEPRLFSHDSALTITWDDAFERFASVGYQGKHVTGYRVQWKTAGQQYHTSRQADIELSEQPRHSHTVTSLVNGTEYTVRVLPLNGAMVGAPVEMVGAPVAIEEGAPPRLAFYSIFTGPQSRLIEGIGYPVHRVEWHRAPIDGRELVNYRVQWKAAGQQYHPSRERVVRNQTSTDLPGIETGRRYTVRVAGIVSDTEDAPATEVSGTAYTAPGGVQGLNATTADRSLTVTWSVPDGRGAPVTHYRLGSRSAGSVMLVDTAAHRYEFTDVVPGSILDVFIIAYNAFGAGWAPKTGLRTVSTVPGAPAAVAAVPSDAALSVSWSAPHDGGGTAIGSYRVRWKAQGQQYSTDREHTEDGDGDLIHEITGLTNATAYTVAIDATNNSFTGPAAEVTATPSAATGAPGAPRELAALPADAALTLSWAAQPGSDPAIDEYLIRWKGPGEDYDSTREATTPTDTPRHQITGLTNGTRYDVQVSAVLTGGEAGPATVTVATPAATPSAVRDLIAVPVDGNATLVSWLPPDSHGGAGIDHYRVLWKAAGEDYDHSLCSHRRFETTNPHWILPRAPGAGYSLSIAAVNSAGTGTATEITPTADD